MKIEIVDVSVLRPSEYNPRKITPGDFEQIKRSIEEFGFVQPLVVNRAEGRENVVIGGHQRLEVAKKMGLKEVPVYYVEIPDLQREKELNIRLNRNQADWDWGKLRVDFDMPSLVDWGFEDWEFGFAGPSADTNEYQGNAKEKDLSAGVETRNKCPNCNYEY